MAGGARSYSGKQIILVSRTTWTSLHSMRETTQMNKYGLLAQEHWQRYAPNRYESLDNPQEYFTEMGEAISNEIEVISDHLQRQLPKNLEFMDRLGQMNMIWYQAEEAVLGELVYSVETETDVYEELSDLLGQLPPPDLLDQHLEALEDAMEREADGGVGRSKFRSRSGSEQELGGEDSAPIDRREPGGSDDQGASQGSPISAPEPSRAREQLVNERVRPGAPLPSCCRDRRVGHRRRVGLLVDDRWSGHGWVRGRIR